MASMMLSCFTWLVVRFLKGIQPIEAENLLPVRTLHQGEPAGVNLYLNRSLSGSAVLLVSPRASNPAGPGKGKRRETLKHACFWSLTHKLVSSDAACDSQQDGVLGLGFWLHLHRHLCWHGFWFGLFFHRRLLLLVINLHRLIKVHTIKFQSIIHWKTCYHKRVRSQNREIAKKKIHLCLCLPHLPLLQAPPPSVSPQEEQMRGEDDGQMPWGSARRVAAW